MTLGCGPYKGVFNTTDPYDDSPDYLYDALNMYIPDPADRSGIYQRPGFIRCAGGSASMGSKLQATQWLHIMRDGTKYNFCITDGKVFRVASDLASRTDVTPVGVTIDAGTTTRVYMQSYNDTLIVSDGVNRPWYGTNLGATPITGTYIQMTTAAGAWTAFGQPTIFSGVLVFIVNSPAAGAASKARVAITWCEPGDQTLGYEQTGYTDFANIIQTSSRQLFAILGTNNGLYYWRDTEIGIAQGIADGSFASTATYAAVSTNIGCVAPATVQRYLDTIYFCDQLGRPQRLPIGGTVTEPQMWLQMRKVVNDEVDNIAEYPSVLVYRGVAGIDVERNLYVCAPYVSSATLPPYVAYAFDAKTGTYVGRWIIGTTSITGGVGIKGFGPFYSTVLGQNTDILAVVSENQQAANDTYTGAISSAALTDANYSSTPFFNIVTNQLGYSANVIYNCGETCTVIQMNGTSSIVAVSTPYETLTTQGTPTPGASLDGTFRVVVGTDVRAARGVQVTVTNLGTTPAVPQWGVQRVELVAVPSLAGPGEF